MSAGVKYPHTHSWMCTRGVCGVGPSRDELVRDTLLRKLERGESLVHYKPSEIEVMRLALASSAPSSTSSPASGIEHGVDGGAVAAKDDAA